MTDDYGCKEPSYMENEIGWKEAIVAILEEAQAPLHYSQIAERIYERKLRTEQTATPANTVAAAIAASFKNEGKNSPFRRTSRGYYPLLLPRSRRYPYHLTKP
jgi:hypothetical protein